MLIRTKLRLSYLSILLLFGLNVAVYYLGNYKRSAALEELSRATNRHLLIVRIQGELSDLQRQIFLMGQIVDDVNVAEIQSAEIEGFDKQTALLMEKIGEIRSLQKVDVSRTFEDFEETADQLIASWRVFYENFGHNHVKALTELAVRGDGLSFRGVHELLPRLEAEENQRVTAAGTSFYEVAHLADRITILIFLVTILLSALVAFILTRQLSKGIQKLRRGVLKIGSGDLEERIKISSKDELGELAYNFNDMARSLDKARNEVNRTHEQLEARHHEVEKQRERSKSLLLNILPPSVAGELEACGKVDPRYYEDVTVMFTDMKGFSLSTDKLAADELVAVLHRYFTEFDQIITRYGLEKLKTIGDSYMCVAGMPERSSSHTVDSVLVGFEILAVSEKLAQMDLPVNWSVRIGIHTGPVIAGVVGIKKFAFDIWGETVNLASRMESSGVPNRINLSENTYSRVKDFFQCECRGAIRTKDQQDVVMHLASGIQPSLMEGSGEIPLSAFRNRYRTYFQKEPPAFPPFLLEKRNTAFTENGRPAGEQLHSEPNGSPNLDVGADPGK